MGGRGGGILLNSDNTFPTWRGFLPKQFTLDIMKRLIAYRRLIGSMESFRKREKI